MEFFSQKSAVRGKRNFPPIVTGRAITALILVCVVGLPLGCSPALRSRVMHFFFEYPEPQKPVDAVDRRPIRQAETPALTVVPADRFASRHPPFVQRACASCHVRDQSQSPRADFQAACRECHQTYFTYHRFGHAPAASGDCRICHVMHVSKYAALLTESQAVLCTRCHEAHVDESALTSYHRDIVGLDCTACHEAHFGESQMLLKANRPGNATQPATGNGGRP